MADKAKLEDLRISRDENGDPLPRYIETEIGEVGIKPQSIGDLERLRQLGQKDQDEADTDELIDLIQEIVLEPDLGSVDKETLKDEYDFIELRKLIQNVSQEIMGGVEASDVKNQMRSQLS